MGLANTCTCILMDYYMYMYMYMYTCTGVRCSPLSFIFEETVYDSAQGLLMKVVRQPYEDM